MSMYLPNPAVRPTGDEAGEFLDIPPMAEVARPGDATGDTHGGDGRAPGATVPGSPHRSTTRSRP
jgi:hypothetical protein